jgi:NAD(P)-dependent dehydrogenase (short-subunit alcohol dehydrogenase family)
MTGLLTGKTAVVTGGTSGIGLATAHRFIAEGAYVFITGRREPELRAAVDALGPRAVGVRGDVGVSEDLDRLYAAVAERGNGLDVVFANAGITDVARLTEVTEHHLDLLLTTNVKGIVFTVQKALPLLRDNASVILNGSIAAERGREGKRHVRGHQGRRSILRPHVGERAAGSQHPGQHRHHRNDGYTRHRQPRPTDQPRCLAGRISRQPQQRDRVGSPR